MILEELKIEDTTKCYVCGSSILNEGDSLHAWSISYNCGCKILGANGDNSIYLDKYCKYYKRKVNLESLLNKEI